MLELIMPEKKTNLVYSTDRIVPRTEEHGRKSSGPVSPASQQKIYVRLERKGRGGKTVTLVEGVGGPAGENLLRRLKIKLGTGGSLKDGVIEIQGDHRESVTSFLLDMGYRPRRSGG